MGKDVGFSTQSNPHLPEGSIGTCYLIAAADPGPWQWTVYARAWGRADRAIIRLADQIAADEAERNGKQDVFLAPECARRR